MPLSNYFLRKVLTSASSSMIDRSEEFGWIVKDLCRVFPDLFAAEEEENMLLATSVILRRFFFLPMSDSMDMSIELTLIASLFCRFLDLCSKNILAFRRRERQEPSRHCLVNVRRKTGDKHRCRKLHIMTPVSF